MYWRDVYESLKAIIKLMQIHILIDDDVLDPNPPAIPIAFASDAALMSLSIAVATSANPL